jgi:hypothetical protein
VVYIADDEARGGGEAVQVKISGDRLRVFFSPRADDIFLRVTDVRVPSDAPAPIAHLYNKKNVGVNILA